ncbi:MAG: DUF711 family protein [Thermoproteota archaeon]
MTLIRALAIHLGNFSNYRPLKIEDLKEKVSTVKHKFKTNIWTTRVILPKIVQDHSTTFKGASSQQVSERDLEKIIENSEELIKELGIDFVAIPFDYNSLRKIRTKFVELFSVSNRLFFSLNIGNLTGDLPIKESKDSIQLLKEIFESNGEEACTRFAISFGGQPETAYFPDTAAKNFGFSLSLRYVNDILNRLGDKKDLSDTIESIARPIQNEALRVQKYANMKFLGIDLSLSPWMKESILKLIEEVGDITEISPGFYTSIWKLNEAIMNTKKIKKIGFNEVMLPVAEDSLLKEYFASRKMMITELIGAISVCVAGLDMVAVSANLKNEVIEKLVLDSISISKARKKKIGIRLILANGKAGGEIKLSRFGKVPVIKI